MDNNEQFELTINEDIEKFRPEAWKGFSFNEIKKIAIILSLTIGIFIFLHIFCYLPSVLCIWLTLLFILPIAICLFLKVQEMSLTDYLYRLWIIQFDPPLAFVSDEVEIEEKKIPTRKEKKEKRKAEKDEYAAYCKQLKQERKEVKALEKEERKTGKGKTTKE